MVICLGDAYLSFARRIALDACHTKLTMVNGGKSYFQKRVDSSVKPAPDMCPGGRLPVILDEAAFNEFFSQMCKSNSASCSLKNFSAPISNRRKARRLAASPLTLLRWGGAGFEVESLVNDVTET